MSHPRKKSSGDLRYWFLISALLIAAAYIFSDGDVRSRVRDRFIDDTKFAFEIKQAAEKHGIPPELVRALIRKESGFDPYAKGKAGEIGLMQILPAGSVADWARVNQQKAPPVSQLYDVKLNLEIGCWYLGRALDKWKNYRCGTELALAKYNAGAKNSSRWKPDAPDGDVISRIDFPVTCNYVKIIMKNYRKYLSESGSLPAE